MKMRVSVKAGVKEYLYLRMRMQERVWGVCQLCGRAELKDSFEGMERAI